MHITFYHIYFALFYYVLLLLFFKCTFSFKLHFDDRTLEWQGAALPWVWSCTGEDSFVVIGRFYVAGGGTPVGSAQHGGGQHCDERTLL